MLNNARYDVLHWLAELGQLLNAVLNNLLSPLRDLVAIIDSVSVEDTGNNLTDKLLNLGGVEFRIVLEVCHF